MQRGRKGGERVEPIRARSAHRGEQGRQWEIWPEDARREELARQLKVSPILAQVLINRGITDAQTGARFLRPKLADLISPEEMPGIQGAVERIRRAVKDREKITLYGDYDVDGIAGVAILWQMLNMLGAKVDYYIPHRVEEGYGLNTEAVEAIAKRGTKLLVSIDCGITAHASAERASELGVDLIICDHHQLEERLPSAAAIVHPGLDAAYRNQDSSGSMVAFKAAWAVAGSLRGGRMSEDLREFMISATSLAAMGTIADVMELRGENRVLASYGLGLLAESKLAGVRALIESASLTGQGLDSYHIGFRLAPMLNAAGRMGHARLAVELLTSSDQGKAGQIAEYLKEQNAQRQRYERKIYTHACQMVSQRGLDEAARRTIVLWDGSWHSGVIGIVAARIVDRFYRPAIMINTSVSPAQGSARSIEGFDILAAIKACSGHLVSFGGHKKAAGVTIEAGKIERFAEDLEGYGREHLKGEACVPKLKIDAIASLSEFRYETVCELGMLGPFGQGNSEPVFATKGVRLYATPRRVGTAGDHLQFAVTDNTNHIRCIGFRLGRLEKKLQERDFFDIAYHVQQDTYNGGRAVQLVVEDIQFE